MTKYASRATVRALPRDPVAHERRLLSPWEYGGPSWSWAPLPQVEILQQAGTSHSPATGSMSVALPTMTLGNVALLVGYLESNQDSPDFLADGWTRAEYVGNDNGGPAFYGSWLAVYWRVVDGSIGSSALIAGAGAPSVSGYGLVLELANADTSNPFPDGFASAITELGTLTPEAPSYTVTRDRSLLFDVLMDWPHEQGTAGPNVEAAPPDGSELLLNVAIDKGQFDRQGMAAAAHQNTAGGIVAASSWTLSQENSEAPAIALRFAVAPA